jgi:hypothetical protein
MIEDEDVLFRPVFEGNFYPATALEDGSIDLAFVMLCNEAIDVRNENNRRAHVWAKEQGANK